MTAKQRRRAEKKERRDVARSAALVAHVRPDWEYTGLLLYRCDDCGTELTSGTDRVGACVVCGNEYASFVRTLEHEVDARNVPRKNRPSGPLILQAP